MAAAFAPDDEKMMAAFTHVDAPARLSAKNALHRAMIGRSRVE